MRQVHAHNCIPILLSQQFLHGEQQGWLMLKIVRSDPDSFASLSNLPSIFTQPSAYPKMQDEPPD